jgi:hypothetical protein
VKGWLALAGITKQSAKAAAAGTATYGFGLVSGAAHRLELDQDRHEITATRRVAGDVIRGAAVPGMAFETRLYPKPLPLLLYGALGTIATSGASAPYTHTITPGTDLPYLHAFGRQDADYVDVRDCHIASLEISFDAPEPPTISVDMVGLVPTYGTSWTITNNDENSDFIPTVDGTFQVDVDGATPASARIKAGTISIENGISPTILADSILPDEVPVGALEISCSLTIVTSTNLADWRSIITGSASGTAVQQTPVYGSVDLLFTLDADTDLQITLDRVAFTADWPDAEPGTDTEIELQLEGVVLQTDANDGITFVVRNAVATY